MRRVARAEDRETAGKLREFFLSQGIDAEIRPAGGAFEILVDDAKAEEALLMAKSLFESARKGGTNGRTGALTLLLTGSSASGSGAPRQRSSVT